MLALGFILLFAFFGWRFLGYLVLFILLFLVVAAAIVWWALWRVKKRIRDTMEQVGRDFAARMRAQGVQEPAGGWDLGKRREDAIDVQGKVQEGRKPRDGADDPDTMEPKG